MKIPHSTEKKKCKKNKINVRITLKFTEKIYII